MNLPRREPLTREATRDTLRLLTGRAGGLTVEEAALAAGCSPDEYRAAAAGEECPSGRMERLAAMTRQLDGIIKARAVGWWWRHPDPKLPGGASPLALLAGEDSESALDRIGKVIEGYYDLSYG